jgi:hypothetical protein
VLVSALPSVGDIISSCLLVDPLAEQGYLGKGLSAARGSIQNVKARHYRLESSFDTWRPLNPWSGRPRVRFSATVLATIPRESWALPMERDVV